MTASGGTAKPPPTRSVADVKRQLSAWGDASDARVAVMRSHIVSGTANLAIMVGIVSLVALAVRRLSPSHAPASKLRLDRASPNGESPVLNAKTPATAQRSNTTWLRWMIISRVGRWLIPHAVQAARKFTADSATTSGSRQPRSVH